MAKLTLTGLAALINAYIDAGKIQIPASTYTADREVLSDLIVKIGKQLMLDSDFTDMLPELDGEALPFGTTIEEYFINLTLPEDFDLDGKDNMAPHRLEFETPYYSKLLGEKTFAVTLDDNQYKRALLGQAEFAGVMAVLMKRLFDSYNLYKFGAKRQLLGTAVDLIKAGSAQIVELAKPTDTATGEAFSKALKSFHTKLVEFDTEDYTNAKVVARSPEVVVYVKGSDILPVIDIDVLAGAFNVDRAEVPVRLRQLQDFGTVNLEGAYAIMLDPRGIRLHPHNLDSTTDRNGKGKFTNHYLHVNFTAFVSYFTNIIVFVEPSE